MSENETEKKDISKDVNVLNLLNNNNDTESNEDEVYTKLVEKFVSSSTSMVDEWSVKEAGNFGKWMDLMKSVMELIQTDYQRTGVEKAKMATDIMQKLGKYYYEKHKDELDDTTRSVLDVIMSDSGANLLGGATSFIKKMLRDMDTNNDGEISKEECEEYCKKMFCCCLPTI